MELASAAQLRRWAALTVEAAPGNTPGEFIATIGAAGLGRLVVEEDRAALAELRRLASDPRWRVREGVAMALQRIGTDDMAALGAIAARWARGNRYEQRAAVAALAEPALLGEEAVVVAALDVFDGITASVAGAADRREAGFRALAKALGYGWSVLVAAAPKLGRTRMEQWLGASDPDVRRVMRDNLSKARLERADPAWTTRWRERLRPPES